MSSRASDRADIVISSVSVKMIRSRTVRARTPDRCTIAAAAFWLGRERRAPGMRLGRWSPRRQPSRARCCLAMPCSPLRPRAGAGPESSVDGGCADGTADAAVGASVTGEPSAGATAGDSAVAARLAMPSRNSIRERPACESCWSTTYAITASTTATEAAKARIAWRRLGAGPPSRRTSPVNRALIGLSRAGSSTCGDASRIVGDVDRPAHAH